MFVQRKNDFLLPTALYPVQGRTYHGAHREEHKPEYEAWRKERNRIDEDRISRQKTAEGNWRREWDNDKVNFLSIE